MIWIVSEAIFPFINNNNFVFYSINNKPQLKLLEGEEI
jgi:hypothetical protein